MSCTCSISCSSEKALVCPIPLRKWGEGHQCHLLSFLSELQIIASHQLQWSPCWRGVTLPISSMSKHQVSNCSPSFLICLAKSAIHVFWCDQCSCWSYLPGLKAKFKWQYDGFQKKAALICWLRGVASSTDIRLSMRWFWGIENEYIMV